MNRQVSLSSSQEPFSTPNHETSINQTTFLPAYLFFNAPRQSLEIASQVMLEQNN